MMWRLVLALSLGMPSFLYAGSLPRTVCQVFTADLTGVVNGTGHVSRNGNRISGTCVRTVDPDPVTFTGESTGIGYGCGDTVTLDWSETIDRHGRATLTCSVP